MSTEMMFKLFSFGFRVVKEAVFATTFGNKETIKISKVFSSEHNHSDTQTINTIGSPSIVQRLSQSNISEEEGVKFPYNYVSAL